MKKFLLIVVAAFAAANVSAANGVKSNFPKAQKKAMVAADAHLGILSKSVNASAMQSANVATLDASNLVANVKKNAPSASDLIPCYSEESGMCLSGLGMLYQNMYEGASYLVEGGKAYFKPYANVPGIIEGVVETVPNQFSSIGADSITFRCTEPIATLVATGAKLYFEPCDWANYAPVRMDGVKTFGAYYLAEAGELYIPEILAIYEEEASTPYHDSYVLYNLDLYPQSLYAEYTSKAIVEWMSLRDGSTQTNDKALAIFGEDCIWVKGVDLGFNEEAWVKFDVDEADESLYVVEQDQALGHADLTTDGTNYFPAILSTVGALHNNGQVTAFNAAENYISKYRWSDNADETSTLAITGNTVFSDYGYMMAPTGLTGGTLSHALFDVTITYESIVGIKEVKGNKQQNDAIYNIAGQRVAKDYKGLVIKNGKKYLVK